MVSRRYVLLGGAAGAAVATFGLTASANAAEAFPMKLTDVQWKARLTAVQYGILRKADTEYPGTSPLLNEHRVGLFSCAGCSQDLFSSKTKFESGTGWPSFWQPLSPKAVVTRSDNTLGMRRTEVLCSKCGGHLGHLFDDGPKPTGLRYCMNGGAMKFRTTTA